MSCVAGEAITKCASCYYSKIVASPRVMTVDQRSLSADAVFFKGQERRIIERSFEFIIKRSSVRVNSFL